MRETLVFIPGFANNARVFRDQMSQLENDFDARVYVMDKFSCRQEMVDHILQEIPSDFLLVGHSMGGWISQAVAAKAPERVTKLILLNTWAEFSPQLFVLQRQILEALKMGKIAEVMQLHLPLLIHPSRLNDAELIHDLQTMTASFSIDVLIQQLEAMLKDSSSLPLHPSIQAPTLIVHSCQDALFPQDHAILASGIKNSKLKAIEECGHASPMEKPQEVTDLIGAFLRETA